MKKALWLCVTGLTILSIQAQELNGFKLKDALVPPREILRGGPPRDGIPSIDRPMFKKASLHQEFGNNIPVLGVFYNGMAKAYPINIMDWHEIVNDDFAGKPVVVTYCPLCGSGIAFEADVSKGKAATFGVSGLLYNSDVLLYDRSTQSLWSQIMGKAISGPLKGQELQPINTQRMTLGAWKTIHPQTLVLTTQTGYTRNYQSTPYGNYQQENWTYFPVTNKNDIMHMKEWVVGIEHKGVFKAYPVKHLNQLSGSKLVDEVGGEKLTITWDNNGENIHIKDASGNELVAFQMFWFAWAAFHPDTEILR